MNVEPSRARAEPLLFIPDRLVLHPYPRLCLREIDVTIATRGRVPSSLLYLQHVSATDEASKNKNHHFGHGLHLSQQSSKKVQTDPKMQLQTRNMNIEL